LGTRCESPRKCLRVLLQQRFEPIGRSAADNGMLGEGHTPSRQMPMCFMLARGARSPAADDRGKPHPSLSSPPVALMIASTDMAETDHTISSAPKSQVRTGTDDVETRRCALVQLPNQAPSTAGAPCQLNREPRVSSTQYELRGVFRTAGRYRSPASSK